MTRFCPPPPVTFGLFSRFGSRTRYVRRAEHSLAGAGVHGRLSVARHRGAGSGGKRDSRGEHDGVPLQAAEDAAKHRLWRCRRRMKTFNMKRVTTPQLAQRACDARAREREIQKRDGEVFRLLPVRCVWSWFTRQTKFLAVSSWQLAVSGAHFFFSCMLSVLYFFFCFRFVFGRFFLVGR